MAHLMAAMFLSLLAQASASVSLTTKATTHDSKHAEGTVSLDHMQVMAQKFKDEMKDIQYTGDDGDDYNDVKGSIKTMIELINTRLLAFCIKGAEQDQNHINECWAHAQHYQGLAQGGYADACEATTACSNAYANLERATATCNECTANLTRAGEVCDRECAADKAMRYGRWDAGPSTYGKHKCNFTDCYDTYPGAESCDDYRIMREEMDSLGEACHTNYKKYFQQHDVCGQSVNSYGNRQRDVNTAHYQWKNAHSAWDHKQSIKKMKICSQYADAVRSKCHFYEMWVNGNHSEAQAARNREYEGLCKIRCMLEEYMKTGKFDEEEMNTCAYNKCDVEVIAINLHDGDMLSLMHDQGNCLERTWKTHFGDNLDDEMNLYDEDATFRYCKEEILTYKSPGYPKFREKDELGYYN